MGLDVGHPINFRDSHHVVKYKDSDDLDGPISPSTIFTTLSSEKPI